METITSKQNPAIVAAGKLADKKYRDMTRTFAFEGAKLLYDALLSGIELARIFVTDAAYQKHEDLLGRAEPSLVTMVSDEVYAKLSFEKAPQGIFCIAKYRDIPMHKEDDSFVILLDGVSDPGNLGAILRSAEAFGVDAVYLSDDAADLYNPKTVRACMGAGFRARVCRVPSLSEEMRVLQERGFRILATALSDEATDIRETELSGKLGFVIGNEGHGISDAVLSQAAECVILPMREGPQSLNAAVAAGIVMWEAARRRQLL